MPNKTKLFPLFNIFTYGLLIILAATSIYWNEDLFFWVIQGRIAFLNNQMVWFTTYGFLALLSVLALLTFTWKKSDRRWQVLLILALLAAFFGSHFVKFLVQEPRPYDLFQIIPLAREHTLSFPSTHTALAFSLIPLLLHLRYGWGVIWSIISIGVAFSRVYIGVHMPIEVIYGALLGFFLGDFFRILQIKFSFLSHWEEKLELRRQVFHAVFGLILAFLIKWAVIPIWFLLLVSLGGLFISVLSLKFRLPLVSYFLKRFERPRLLKRFPGRGAFFFVFSAWLTFVLFDFYIALSAVLILALMDSTAHIVGKYWGKIPNPLNRKKHLEGFFIGYLAGVFGALFFMPFQVALFGAFIGSFIEIFDVRLSKYKIDDNLLVPTLSALAMSIIT